jgi:predicted metalloprotease with PDZ domain
VPKVRTDAQFINYINKTIRAVLNEIAKETTDELMNIVWTDWYMANGPSDYYHATGQLLDSVVSSKVKKSGSGYKVDIYMDSRKLKPNYLVNTFSEHMGFDGRPFTSSLIEVIEEGNPSSIYSHEGIEMFKKTSDWLEKELPRIASVVFARYGFAVHIT